MSPKTKNDIVEEDEGLEKDEKIEEDKFIEEIEEIVEETQEFSLKDLPGVGEKIAEKLEEAGYLGLMAIAVTPVAQMAEDVGVGEATANKIIQAARKSLKMNFITGTELLQRRGAVDYITTGSEELNRLLGGKGVETQSLTETFAEFGSGKTQIALQLAVNVQLPKERGGIDADCVFIDTENTFRPQRIIQMAKAAGLDPEKVLSRIRVARAYSSDHQMLLAEKVPDLIEKEKLPIKLLIIDSLTGLFRAEYVGRGTLARRQQKLNSHLHTLQRLSDRFNLAVYVTNQVMSRPDVFFGDPTKAVGGHILAHAATYRIYLRKSKGNKRIARLVDSPHLPDGEVVFTVDEDGVKD